MKKEAFDKKLEDNERRFENHLRQEILDKIEIKRESFLPQKIQTKLGNLRARLTLAYQEKQDRLKSDLKKSKITKNQYRKILAKFVKKQKLEFVNFKESLTPKHEMKILAHTRKHIDEAYELAERTYKPPFKNTKLQRLKINLENKYNNVKDQFLDMHQQKALGDLRMKLKEMYDDDLQKNKKVWKDSEIRESRKLYKEEHPTDYGKQAKLLNRDKKRLMVKYKKLKAKKRKLDKKLHKKLDTMNPGLKTKLIKVINKKKGNFSVNQSLMNKVQLAQKAVHDKAF